MSAVDTIDSIHILRIGPVCSVLCGGFWGRHDCDMGSVGELSLRGR